MVIFTEMVLKSPFLRYNIPFFLHHQLSNELFISSLSANIADLQADIVVFLNSFSNIF